MNDIVHKSSFLLPTANILVIVGLLGIMKDKTVVNRFVVSLAAADLFMSVIIIPVKVLFISVNWCFHEPFILSHFPYPVDSIVSLIVSHLSHTLLCSFCWIHESVIVPRLSHPIVYYVTNCVKSLVWITFRWYHEQPVVLHLTILLLSLCHISHSALVSWTINCAPYISQPFVSTVSPIVSYIPHPTVFMNY